MAQGSLYYFAKYVLGFSDIQLQPHWELCTFLEKWGRTSDCLILLPRGTFKSSITSVAFPLWCLIHDRSMRILLTSGQLENTKNFLGLIRNNLEANQDFRRLFGDWDSNRGTDTWTSTALSIAGRTIYRAEDSITATSMEVTKVSQHYDMAIVDDIMNEKNVTTKEQIDKADSYMQLLNPFLDPQKGTHRPGPRIVVGTRWHFDDVYGRIQAKERKYRKETRSWGWRMLIRPAYNKSRTQVFFPSRFSLKYLDRLREEGGMSRYHFSCQYLNDPIPDEDATFRMSDMGFFWMDERGNGMRVCMGAVSPMPRLMANFAVMDPSVGEHSKSDYTAIDIIGTDPENNMYVMDVRRDHWQIPQQIDEMVRAHLDYRPFRFGVESVAFQKALIWAFRKTCEDRGQWFPVEELHTDNRVSKEMRIRGLAPFVTKHRIYLRVACQFDLTLPTEVLYRSLDGGMAVLADEMLRFPLGANDDCLDALAYAPQIVYPATTESRPATVPARSIMGLKARLHRIKTDRSLSLR